MSTRRCRHIRVLGWLAADQRRRCAADGLFYCLSSHGRRRGLVRGQSPQRMRRYAPAIRIGGGQHVQSDSPHFEIRLISAPGSRRFLRYQIVHQWSRRRAVRTAFLSAWRGVPYVNQLQSCAAKTPSSVVRNSEDSRRERQQTRRLTALDRRSPRPPGLDHHRGCLSKLNFQEFNMFERPCPPLRPSAPS